jgi:aminopeptidase N
MQNRRILIASLFLIIFGVIFPGPSAAASPNAVHYVLELDISQNNTVVGRTEITFKASGADSLSLLLDGNLTVVNAVLDREKLEFQHSGEEVLLEFKRPIQGTNRLVVDYAGILEHRVDGHSWAHLDSDGAFAVYEANWYPHIPSNRATAEIRLKSPPGWTSISNGALADYDPKEGVFSWVVGSPEIGFSFASGRYREQQDYEKHIPIRCYLTSVRTDCAKSLRKSLSFFSHSFGNYSYPKMALAEVGGSLNGGHGDNSLVIMSTEILGSSKYTEFMAHEAAHSWFGGRITAEDSRWLTEGFATYAGVMYLENLDSSLARKALSSKRNEYLKVKSEGRDKPILSASGEYDDVFHATVYSKGAYVLHMLRHVVGDEAFSQILRDYVETFRSGSASVADFQALSEEVSGMELEWFFRQWLGSTAVPDYYFESVEKVFDGHLYHVKVVLAQSGDGLLKMPVDVTLVTAMGKTTKRVWIDSNSAEVEFQSKNQPIYLEIDRGGWLLESRISNNRLVLHYPLNFFGLKLLISNLARTLQAAF